MLSNAVQEQSTGNRAGHARRPTVLIVDDNETMITVLTAMLEEADYPVIRATHPDAALHFAEKASFEIVLVDRNLKGSKSGAELIRALKAKRPELISIMVTGDTSRGAVLEALRAGAFDYLTKPVTPDVLLHTLEKAELQILANQQDQAATDAIRLAKEHAEAESLAKNQLLANIKRQLREPISAVVGFSELLTKQDSGQAAAGEAAAYAEAIRESSAQLLSIVSDALDLIQIETQNVDLDICQNDLESVIERACTNLQVKADHSGVSVIHQARGEPFMALTDKRRLMEIMRRLLTHALTVVAPGSLIMVWSGMHGDLECIGISCGSDRQAGQPDMPDAGEAGRIDDDHVIDNDDGSEMQLGIQMAHAIARLIGAELDISYPGRQSIRAMIYFSHAQDENCELPASA